MSTDNSVVPTPHSESSQNRAVGAGLTVAFLVLVWGIACRFLSSEWSINEQYNYGWFVPFFAAYLFWLRWERRPLTEVHPGRKGTIVFLAIIALFLLLPVRLFEIGNPDWRPLGWLHVAIGATVTFAILYFAGGKPWVRHFAFPILFLFVAVPWLSLVEAPLVEGLMRFVASAASETLALCGIPAEVEGNLIRVSSGVVGVNEACSGVRSLQTSLMIGLLFGELNRLSISRRIVLVCAALVIALFSNFLRALFLVWIAARQNVNAVSSWHDTAGYAIVILVALGSFGIAAVLRRGREIKPETPVAAAQPRLIPAGILIGALAWVLAVEFGAEAWYRIHERNVVTVPGWSVAWPESASGFRPLPIDDGIRQTLRFDQGREAVWNAPGLSAGNSASKAVNYVFFFRWNPGSSSVVRARAHRPDICLPSAGWRQTDDRGFKTYPSGLSFRRATFAQEHGAAVAYTFFCLQEDKTHANEPRPDLALPLGQQPDWSFPARLRVVRNGVRNLGQQVLEIAILAPSSVKAESVEAHFRTLLGQLVVPL